jgi:hypothetical protein
MPSEARALRADEDPPCRWAPGPGSARALALLLGTCAFLVALAWTPIAAGAASCLPHLGRVKSFHGTARMSLNASATGVDPDQGGFESITMDHQAIHLKFLVHKAGLGRNGIDFLGHATQGDVEVKDRWANTGTGFSGTLAFGGELTRHRPNFGFADLVIDRRKNKCRYRFFVTFAVIATYTGDEEVERPVPEITGTAYSGWNYASRFLEEDGVVDAVSAPAYLGDCASRLGPCYQPGGGWLTKFATLALCNSVVAVNCANERTTRIGHAEFSYVLSPTFKKKKKYRHRR